MVHNVFLGQLEVSEHISDIIFIFQALFDSPQHEKAMEAAKIAVFRPFGAYKQRFWRPPWLFRAVESRKVLEM